MTGAVAVSLRVARALAVVATLALTAAAVPARAQEGFSDTPAVGLGPLVLRSQSPFSILRLSPTPVAPLTTPRGRVAFGLLVSWDNYFAYDPGIYTFDVETLSLTLGASYGLTDRLSVDALLPVSYRGGGVLDRFIEGFEGVLGVPNRERTMFERNRFLVRVVGPSGEVFERTGSASGWGLEDAVVSARYQLTRGSERTPAVLASALVKLPVGREASLRSTGGVDGGVSLGLGQRISPHAHLYAALSYMRFAPGDVAGIPLQRNQWAGYLALERRVSPRTSLLLQAARVSAASSHFGGLGSPSTEIMVGFKRLLGAHVVLEASVLENLFVFDNSPDVGFHLGFGWRP